MTSFSKLLQILLCYQGCDSGHNICYDDEELLNEQLFVSFSSTKNGLDETTCSYLHQLQITVFHMLHQIYALMEDFSYPPIWDQTRVKSNLCYLWIS